jgi:hypothetical protein
MDGGAVPLALLNAKLAKLLLEWQALQAAPPIGT